jgi:hypothetical protein
MARTAQALLAALFLLPAVRAADSPAGSWKFTLPRSNLSFLMKLEQKEGKWTGEYLGPNVQGLPKIVFGDISVTADGLRFSFKIPGEADFQFEGKLPPEPKTGRILGSLLVRGKQLELAHLEPSKLKIFDQFEFNKETLEQSTDAQILFDAAIQLMSQAGEKKAKVEEVRGWADKAVKPAEAYGVRWQRTVAVRLAQAIADQKDYGPVAVEYARKAERLLDPDDAPAVQMEVLSAIAQVLERAGKADDAKQINARLAKLEERDYADYFKKLPFKPETFEGRKGKSDRAVLVEFFTNVAVDTGVAPEVALAAMGKTYKPNELVLLQYDLNVQKQPPDPLFVPESIDRVRYYEKKIKSFPALFIDGKWTAPETGPLQGARKTYGEYRKVIDALMEKDAEAKLQLEATRKGNEIGIKATWSDVAKTGEAVRLRLVLVESPMRLSEGTGQPYHHAVVRAFPGGVKGTALTKKSGEQAITVNLDDARTKLNDYLDEADFPKSGRPLGFKNLRVVAFIQDDDGNEVYQAVQVDVK